MQHCLIDQRPGQHGFSIWLVGDRHAVEPRASMTVEVAFDPNRVDVWHCR
jgi:hypothetical protein